ncbi:N-acetyltransferase eco [Eumeta japonica]|uniref:N-acetyltransferase eco n=1 Tax=Eumeta variegata TaxID=151549 RepID=A0A4C1XIN8_EUMVA|nr:N-acetyltransferase eco [Eumeta japonica]
MAAMTPRRSSRLPHTPKVSERKKGLFQGELRADSLMKHRLPVVDSESDPEDCEFGGLGIISAIDSSSSDEYDQNVPRTPVKSIWYETRSQSTKLLKESHNLKNFMKSPFTLHKYQTKYLNRGFNSTPTTPHFYNNPDTPSSSVSCASVHTTSSESSRARKSLATLIADTESCSSSLKDLNFNSDSETDSKENTPTKQGLRKSNRKKKMTPRFASFKGVLLEQKKNFTSPNKAKIDTALSPSKMHKTPHTTSEITSSSPPKINHRKMIVEIGESPEPLSDNEKSYKRLRSDDECDGGPQLKYTKLDTSGTAPKARLSLFTSDIKEIPAKTFYGKSASDLNTSFTTKISNAIIENSNQPRKQFGQSHCYRKKMKKTGQINLGVRHRIRKPKFHNKNKVVKLSVNSSSKVSQQFENRDINQLNNTSQISQTSSQGDIDNEIADPFNTEKRTIDILLSQWTEEVVPESEMSYKYHEEMSCFNKGVIEETNPIFNPATATPVNPNTAEKLQDDSETVIVELGQNSAKFTTEKSMTSDNKQDEMETDNEHTSTHGSLSNAGDLLPVDGGYIVVNENGVTVQEDLPDLDAIERELQMLDEQILKMAESNNIDASVVLASTETIPPSPGQVIPEASVSNKNDDQDLKLFPIFSKANTGSTPKSTKVQHGKSTKKIILKNGSDQYVIDAGQKRFGATQCSECGVIYQIGDPQDEHDHTIHHYAFDILKYNGSKDDMVCGVWAEARVVRVRGGRPGWKKVHQLLNSLVHPYLGYVGDLPEEEHTYTAYLYIEKRQIIGCAIAEPKTKAHKLIPGDPDCCTPESYPVHCGISRLWTHVNHRRKGVAGRLLDCARASFLHGRPLHRHEIAFSAPTQLGKEFAAKYTGVDNFYVYLD